MFLIFFKNLFMDLYRQPMRTFLTLSGVIWGTFAIILLLAFGDGVGKSQKKRMHGMGVGIAIVWPGRTTVSYKGFSKGRLIRVTPDDLEQIRSKIKDIKRLSPEFMRYRKVRYQREEFNNNIVGTNIEYSSMRNLIPQEGRYINDIDLEKKRRVCFLGDTIAENLFKRKNDIVGNKILINGIPFIVIGVMKEKTQNSNYSGSDKYAVFIPWTTYSAMYGQKYVNNFIFQPRNPLKSKEAIQLVRENMGNMLGFSPGDRDALGIWDFADNEKNMNNFFVAFTIFLGMIGSFTLLVGGIGVASIMLVVVEERTKEIGIKLAVGAKRRQILFQFFSEALTIVIIGGSIGFLLAASLLKLVPVEKIEEYIGIPKMNPMVGIVTILILLLVGVISGIKPAKKASSTNPIEALRS